MGLEIMASQTLTLPDVTSSMWSYVSLFLSWPPVLVILGIIFGLTVGVWVFQRIISIMTKSG